MPITLSQLAECMRQKGSKESTHDREQRLSPWLGPINEAFDGRSVTWQAMTLAQWAHESAGMTVMRESMNYSAEGLIKHYAHRVKPELAQRIGRVGTKPADQDAIAEALYGNRMGNRPGTGDAFKFRGHGPGQVTGSANFHAIEEIVNLGLVNDPGRLTQPQIGARATTTMYSQVLVGYDKAANEGDIVVASSIVNTGRAKAGPSRIKGFPDREAAFARCLKALRS